MVTIAQRVKRAAIDAGLSSVGVCRADPFGGTRRALAGAVESGRHAGMRFTFADPETATDVRLTYPWARSLVVGSWSYLPAAGAPGKAVAGSGRVGRFATEDHYRRLRRGLDAVADVLRDAGKLAEILVDDNRLVDRAAAVRAGIGWWGKNTMVLAPGFGPWALLGSVVTDADLEPDAPMRRDCGTCSACLPACPTGALIAPGVLDARRCLAHISQAPGMVPAPFRQAMGDRVYGCDDCLEACPPGGRLAIASRDPRGRLDLLEILATDNASLLARFSHFYIPRRQPRYLRRNALIALGNSGGPGATAVAAGYLGHPDWLLRAHAAWTLGALGGPLAKAALQAGARTERDPVVVGEIEAAVTLVG